MSSSSVSLTDDTIAAQLSVLETSLFPCEDKGAGGYRRVGRSFGLPAVSARALDHNTTLGAPFQVEQHIPFHRSLPVVAVVGSPYDFGSAKCVMLFWRTPLNNSLTSEEHHNVSTKIAQLGHCSRMESGNGWQCYLHNYTC